MGYKVRITGVGWEEFEGAYNAGRIHSQDFVEVRGDRYLFKHRELARVRLPSERKTGPEQLEKVIGSSDWIVEFEEGKL